MARKKWTATDLPDMSGKTVVVTGGSSGLGAVIARELARSGAQVVIGIRNVAKGEQFAVSCQGDITVRRLDLEDLSSIRSFAGEWTGPLDILINNAGIMQVPQGRTVDGFERQIGINHLGHFALTNLLMPSIRDRVVSVSSKLHKLGRIDVTDLNCDRRRYWAFRAYCDSKLANLLFAFELQRRLTEIGSNVRSVAAHPGLASTNLFSNTSSVFGSLYALLVPLMSQDAEHGALPMLYAATQDIPGGTYIGPDGPTGLRGHPTEVRPSRQAGNPDLGRRLWEESARLTGT